MDTTQIITYCLWLLFLFVGFCIGGLTAFFVYRGFDGFKARRVHKKTKKHKRSEKRLETKYQHQEKRKKKKKVKEEEKRRKLEDRLVSSKDRETSYTDFLTSTTGTSKKDYILEKRGGEDSSYGIVKRRLSR